MAKVYQVKVLVHNTLWPCWNIQWLDKGEVEAGVSNKVLKHEQKTDKYVLWCFILVGHVDKDAVLAFMTMELGASSEIVGSQFPVGSRLVTNLDIAILLYLLDQY